MGEIIRLGLSESEIKGLEPEENEPKPQKPSGKAKRVLTTGAALLGIAAGAQGEAVAGQKRNVWTGSTVKGEVHAPKNETSQIISWLKEAGIDFKNVSYEPLKSRDGKIKIAERYIITLKSGHLLDIPVMPGKNLDKVYFYEIVKSRSKNSKMLTEEDKNSGLADKAQDASLKEKANKKEKASEEEVKLIKNLTQQFRSWLKEKKWDGQFEVEGKISSDAYGQDRTELILKSKTGSKEVSLGDSRTKLSKEEFLKRALSLF